jgi:hypothetical protein
MEGVRGLALLGRGWAGARGSCPPHELVWPRSQPAFPPPTPIKQQHPDPSSTAQGVITGAASADNLLSLALLPNVWPHFTQLDPFQVPAWLLPAQAGAPFTGVPRMPSTSAATLLACKLPGLQHLAMASDAGNQADFFSQLQGMSSLTSLDLLTGSAVQSKPLQVGARPRAPCR